MIDEHSTSDNMNFDRHGAPEAGPDICLSRGRHSYASRRRGSHAASPAQPEAEPPAADKKREIRSWIICLAVALVVAVVIRLFVFELVIVDGPSMQPTLHTSQTVFVEKVSKLFSGVSRGQIIIVHYPGSSDAYVKRLVGLPGDTLEISGGKLLRNGQVIEEPYIAEEMDFSMAPVTVPEGHFFVLGDNRNHSFDSSELGVLPEENIVGHALFVLWPPSDIKFLAGA